MEGFQQEREGNHSQTHLAFGRMDQRVLKCGGNSQSKSQDFFQKRKLKKMLLIKNDGQIGFIEAKKKLGWLSSFIISL